MTEIYVNLTVMQNLDLVPQGKGMDMIRYIDRTRINNRKDFWQYFSTQQEKKYRYAKSGKSGINNTYSYCKSDGRI